MLNDIVIQADHLSKKFRIGTKERLTLFTSIRQKLSGDYPTKDFWSLQDVSFSVKKGEMLPIIGPNGAGKTTLLRILSGIMAPTGGTFSVKDEVSCVFELGLGFNARFTAIDNVYLYGALHGLSKKEVDKKMPSIVEFAELEGFMETRLGEYSSGMRARLAFATVIQTVSGIAMIDEVLSVGDAGFQKKCIKEIERILNSGCTILFITHGVNDVKYMCKRALYLDKGRQVGFGDVNELTELYENNTKAKEMLQVEKGEAHRENMG